MSATVMIPPLRIPLTMDLTGVLASWLDSHNNREGGPDFTSDEVGADLEALHTVRRQLSDGITAHDDYAPAKALIPVMHEYYAMLLECESKGFPAASSTMVFRWKGAFGNEPTTGFSMERSSILWNLAAIEAYNASTLDVTLNKKAWMMANKNLQLSFTFCHHMYETLEGNNPALAGGRTPTDFTLPMVSFWKNVLQAQAQMAGLEKACQTNRPKHLLFAKIAQAACPLWDQAADACASSPALSSKLYTAKAWSSFFSARAQYHASAVQLEKKQLGQELACLEKCLGFATTCQECLVNVEAESRLHRDFETFFKLVQDRYQAAQQELPPGIVIPNDANEIRGELLGKGATALPKTMTVLTDDKKLFTNLLGPAARHAMEGFARDMDQFVQRMTQRVESMTESGRKALARVNLPHSLTAYKQERSGGGIPMDLWERVDAIQQERRIANLKQELWGLRDVAEQARSIFLKTEKQLQEDVEMDQLFRQQNASFEGHDVVEIQRSFRQTCAHYEKLLTKSQEGDAVLLRRLEALDQDPKYKLLQFGKSQLDRLLPGNGGSQAKHIDTTHLSRLLVELSNLFHEREVTLGNLKKEVKNFDIRKMVNEIDPASPTAEQDYQLAVKKAQKSFSGIAYEIQLNIDKQMELLDTIMVENERFMHIREAGASSAASESCIAMIEDAIEEIDQLTKHLREGKDFYDIVIPKLEDLKQEVGDASVRLTVERCEFEDNHTNSADRDRQMEEDARMAASLAGDVGGSSSVPPRSGEVHPLSDQQPGADYQSRGDTAAAASHPGVVNVSHGEPQVRVDDEKVASLIGMDFDPDKVVEALRKYDNNMEEALNELLSG